MSTQPGAVVYTQGFGSRPENVEVPIVANVVPSSSNIYPVGKRWINQASNTEYACTSLLTSGGITTATWTLLGAGSGDLNTLTTDDTTVVTPTAGNINVAGASGQLDTTGSGSTVTINIASPATAPGAFTSTGLLTGDAGITTSGGATNINSGTNATNISTDASATTVHIATGAAAKTAVFGSTNSTSTTTVQSGSGGISLAGAVSGTSSITAATTLTATSGAITATNGNVVLGTAGNKIVVATGSNASVGTSAVMSGTPGAVTVSTTASSATAKIFYSRAVTGGTPGQVSITAQDGTGFTLTSTGNETSTFNWWIINA